MSEAARHHVEIHVTPRPGILDPEGKAIQHALQNLGYEGLGDVRVGKAIAFDLAATSPEDARRVAEEMCRQLLANPVTEDFQIQVDGAAAPATAPGGGRA